MALLLDSVVGIAVGAGIGISPSTPLPMASAIMCASESPINDGSILSIYYLILSFLPLHHHVQGKPAAAAASGKGSRTPAVRVCSWMLLLTMVRQHIWDNTQSRQSKHSSRCPLTTLLPIPSLFHYSHPILSRPAVPNIR